ncbi:glycosyltransferase family 2 protein [Anoxybacillus kestanbolensis]|uniref:glycosyltransferase family 2 protein n=1 Tax=Anoxybacillus kestanbolensis TaxID=227476 RepID=UPI0013016774|nr:glycosyltransferase family A protein [Anoxybacillus kestanbolensis]
MSKWLDVVVIGRNEGSNLEKLYKSLFPIKDILNEIIFVDSASKDDSVIISEKYGCKIICLDESPFLCASVGRYVGTKIAKSEWILYLDGDMELHVEFADWLKDFQPKKDNNIAGYLGYYEYIDNKTNKKERKIIGSTKGETDYFGGAVLLNKNVVLQAGNWSLSVISNEEIELYSRIQALGYKVHTIDITMVTHYTELMPKHKIALDLFVPFFSKKKFYGPGQAVMSAISRGTFIDFIKAQPDLFFTIGVNIISLILICISIIFSNKWPIVVLTVLHVIILIKLFSVKKYVLYQGLSFRIPFGIYYSFKYISEFNQFKEYIESKISLLNYQRIDLINKDTVR